MQITVGKIVSLLVALGYAIVAVVDAHGVTVGVLKVCAALWLPLVLIWFPEGLGRFTDSVINRETPPIMISIFGWFFLVGLPVLVYFLSR